jgi:hypothetical protein
MSSLLFLLAVITSVSSDTSEIMGELATDMLEAIEDSEDSHGATVLSHTEQIHDMGDGGAQVKMEKEELSDGTWTITASDMKDPTAHAVDQTLVGKAEEVLAEKEAEDPLLADPLLSLEKDNEGDEELDDAIENLDTAIEEEERLFYDPALFKEDTVAEMDTNDDGFLDAAELTAHLKKAIEAVRADELSKEEETNADGVKEIIAMMDSNGDGKLSKDEMFGKTTQNEKQKEADNRMFDFADGQFGNKDGLLDEQEIFMMALPQYSADRVGWFKFKAQDHLEEMDTNNDGKVSLQVLPSQVLLQYETQCRFRFPKPTGIRGRH